MFDLKDAVKLVEIIDEKGGGKLDSDSLAQEMNYKTSTIRHHVRSAKYFGLLEQGGASMQILNLRRVFVCPFQTKKTFSPYKMHFCLVSYIFIYLIDLKARVPEESTLSNIIHHEFDISATGKDVLAKNFIASLKFAGLAKEQGDELSIPPNGASVIARTDEPPAVSQKTEEQKPLAPKEDVVFVGNQETQTLNLTLPLPDGGVVKLIVSGNLPKKEADRLKKQIDLFVMED